MVSGRDGSTTSSGHADQKWSDGGIAVPAPLLPAESQPNGPVSSEVALAGPSLPLAQSPLQTVKPESSVSIRPSRSASGSSVSPISLPGSSVQSPRLVNSETVINQGNQQLLRLPGGTDPEMADLMNRLFLTGADGASTHAGNDPAGITIGHFRIEERIGMGGMGAVFRAVDTRLDRFVALKLLAPSQSYDPGAVKRFQNEARAAARLDHENVARVFFIDEDRGLHFIAFEFVTGSNIRDLIRRKGRLTVAETVNYSLQIAYAIKHTAAMGVVHRDVKPSNIIITPTGRTKLVDLGLARKDSSESQGDLTLPGTTLGTFDYISPEQAKDPRSVDVRSDIYSLGCTMFHMLTGRPPYPEGTVLQKLLDHQGKDAPDAAALNPRVPEHLSAIVRRMMNSDRNRRYQTPEQLIRDLTYVAGTLGLRGVNPEGLVWVASKSVQPRRWARHAGWMLTTAALLAIAGLLHRFGEDIGRNLSGENEQSRSGLFGTSTDPATQTVEAPPQSTSEAGSGNSEVAGGSVVALPGESLPIVDGVTPPEALVTTGPEAALKNGATASPATVSAAISPEVAPSAAPLESRPVVQPAMTESDSASAASTAGVPVASEVAVLPRAVAITEAAPATGTEKPTIPTTGTEPARPVAVYSGDSTLLHEYQSLWAACAAAGDGSEIVLQFDGPRIERKACRIAGRNVTIRAARGRTPVINFIPSEIDARESRPRMLSVDSGPVRLVNVEFRLSMPDAPTAECYSMFGLSQSGRLELNRVAVTIDNPQNFQAIVFDVNGSQRRMPTEMPSMPVTGQREPLVVDVADCLFRGNGSLISVTGSSRTQFSGENSVIAISGDVLQLRAGNGGLLSERAVTDLSLEHVTAWMGRSLIRVPMAAVGEESLINCEARNCIFSSLGNAPLIVTDGAATPDDAFTILSWQGERNFYDAITRFWAFSDSDEPYDFALWRDHWQPIGEVGASNDAIIWARRSMIESLPPDFEFSPLQPRDFALPDADDAPQATDGSNAGALLDRIALPFVTLKRETVPAAVPSAVGTSKAAGTPGTARTPDDSPK